MDTSEELYFKPDAKVPLQMGTGFIQRLQELSVWLLSQVPPAELEELQELLEQGSEQFPKAWMNQYYTLAVLLGEIQQQAQAHGMTYQATQPDSSLSDQSDGLLQSPA